MRTPSLSKSIGPTINLVDRNEYASTPSGPRTQWQGARGGARDAAHHVRPRPRADVPQDAARGSWDVAHPVQRNPHDVHELPDRRGVPRQLGAGEEGLSPSPRVVGDR